MSTRAATIYTDKGTGETKEGNPPFFQFYKHNFKLIRQLTNTYPKALQVFLFIVENMDGKNALVVSQKALSEALNVSRQTIFRCVEYLKDNKMLAVYKSGNTNIYAVNADIVWTNTHSAKAFAKFEANVYVSRSEQEDELPVVQKELVGHVNVVRQTDIFDVLNEQVKMKKTIIPK